MEEIRQQENYYHIPPPKSKKANKKVSEEEHGTSDPFRIVEHILNFKESRTQILRSDDRSKWFAYFLQELSKIDLLDKDLVEQYLRHMYRRMYKASTVEHAYNVIVLFLNYLQKSNRGPLRKITKDDIEAFVEHEQDRKMKLSTVRLRLACVRAFLRVLIEQGELGQEVLTRRIMIKLPQSLPRAIDPQDLKKLLSAITGVRDRALVLVLLRTGMRIGELLSTTVNDLNMEEQKILIYAAPKTGGGRVVYFSEDAKSALDAWLSKKDPHRPHLFYANRRTAMTYSGAREIFVKGIEKAELSHKGYSLHSLRHTFASELLNAGMRLEYLQKLLGHTSLEVTRRYARLTDKTRKDEYFKAMQIIERGEIDGHY